MRLIFSLTVTKGKIISYICIKNTALIDFSNYTYPRCCIDCSGSLRIIRSQISPPWHDRLSLTNAALIDFSSYTYTRCCIRSFGVLPNHQVRLAQSPLPTLHQSLLSVFSIPRFIITMVTIHLTLGVAQSIPSSNSEKHAQIPRRYCI